MPLESAAKLHGSENSRTTGPVAVFAKLLRWLPQMACQFEISIFAWFRLPQGNDLNGWFVCNAVKSPFAGTCT